MTTTANKSGTAPLTATGRPTVRSTPRDHQIKDTQKMLLYEDMPRQRMDEDQRVAAQHRMANRMQSIRRWERLAGWAAKRAARIRDR